jgi:hypothetical protein
MKIEGFHVIIIIPGWKHMNTHEYRPPNRVGKNKLLKYTYCT